MSERPVIILVHGAWHVPQHYAGFVSRLNQAGFEVDSPHLPTCMVPPQADATMYTDAELVRSRILHFIDQARDVVLLLHSYGGAVGTEAVKGLAKSERAAQNLSGGVVQLIYMCGFMLQKGESCGAASLPRPEPEPVEFDEASGTTFLCESPFKLFYADVDPQEAKEMESLLVRQAGGAMGGGITYEAWRDIPTTYLRTERDEVLFPHWQDRQIKAVRDAGIDVRVESFDSSHSPFLSMPVKTIEAIERALT